MILILCGCLVGKVQMSQTIGVTIEIMKFSMLLGILNDLWKFSNNTWTWIGGSDLHSAFGLYGTKGIPSVSNFPGARIGAVSWLDTSGAFWMFGGQAYDANNNYGK